MNLVNATAIALDIIKMVDYDMWKEAKAEPEEWAQVVDDLVERLQNLDGDAYDRGYSDGYATALPVED